MKYKIFSLVALSAFLLCGCSEEISSSSNNNSSSNSISTSTSSSSSETSTNSTSSSSDSSSSEKTKSVVTGITINGSISDFYVGDTSRNISASVSGTGDFNKYVTWSVDKENIIEFEAHQNTPYIKALSVGEVTLTATSNASSDIKASIKIEVLTPYVENITLNVGANLTLEKYSTKVVTALVSGKGNYSDSVEWSTDKNGIVEVSGNSSSVTITAKKCGTVVLSASIDDKSCSTSINVTPNFTYESEMTYKKVTNVNELTLGERYIIASSSKDVAMSMTPNNNHLSNANVTKDGDLIKGVKGNEVLTFILEEGISNNSYSFNYKNQYVSSSKVKTASLSSELNSDSSWTINIEDDKTTIKSLNNDFYLKENGFFATYGMTSTTVRDVLLYKYVSGKENIEFCFGDELSLSTNISRNYEIIANGFEPTNYSFELDETIASISVNGSLMSITTSGNEGTTSVKCIASDLTHNVSKSFTLTTTTYNYSFNDDIYAFTSGLTTTSDYLIPHSDDNNGNPFKIDSNDNYLTFEKAYEGDDTFYIKSFKQDLNGEYLNKNSSKARVLFTSEKAVWTLSKEGENIYATIATDQTYYLKYQNGVSHPWICVTTKSPVNLVAFPTGVKNIAVDSSNLVKKTYNDDEVFEPNGLKVNVTFTTSLGDVTLDLNDDVSWNNNFVTNGIKGSLNILENKYSVNVDGLTITHYVLDHISLDTSNVIKDYVVGDYTNTTNLVVTATYKDGEKEKTTNVTDYVVLPTQIKENTTEITVTYNSKQATYTINEVLPNRFVLTDHLTAGYRITFGSIINNCGYEIAPNSDEFTSSSIYVNNLRGSLVFNVVRPESDYRVEEGENVYLYWRLQVVEVVDEQYKSLIGKYLTVDGSKKKLLTLTDDDNSDNSLFWNKSSIENTEVNLFSKITGNILSINKQSHDFSAHEFDSNYEYITIYRDKNVNP